MEYILETDNLVKKYRYKNAVDKVSIHISRGEIYGLIGKNGAGKTTLLKLILGLVKPSEGKIMIKGEKDLNAARHKVGSLIEAPGLYKNRTARENLKLLGILYDTNDQQIDELLKLVGLENVGAKKVKAFSLGMKQRLGLAVALLGDPEILILDEPINGLDPEGIMNFRNIVLKLNEEKNMTFIISSHILDELGKVATKYGVINDGVLVEEKSREEVDKVCGSFYKISTNNDAKACGIIKKKFPKAVVRIEDSYIRVEGEKLDLKKINKILIEADFELLSSTTVQNDFEQFFVERLK